MGKYNELCILVALSGRGKGMSFGSKDGFCGWSNYSLQKDDLVSVRQGWSFPQKKG